MSSHTNLYNSNRCNTPRPYIRRYARVTFAAFISYLELGPPVRWIWCFWLRGKSDDQPGTFKCTRKRCKTCPFIHNEDKITGSKRSIKITDRFNLHAPPSKSLKNLHFTSRRDVHIRTRQPKKRLFTRRDVRIVTHDGRLKRFGFVRWLRSRRVSSTLKCVNADMTGWRLLWLYWCFSMFWLRWAWFSVYHRIIDNSNRVSRCRSQLELVAYESGRKESFNCSRYRP